jgi:peptidoglycan-associated lipoprotein
MRFASRVPIGATILLVACGSDPQREPRSPMQAPAAEAPVLRPASAPARDDPNRSIVAISEDIKRACGISDSDAFFAFNSAQVRARDRAILSQLAVCLTTGPLKGRKMQLVGHADPRGEVEYNYLLGQQRADSVKIALLDAGSSSAQIATTSRGEDDAKGTDETTWARDRRVDVLLAK